MEFIALPVRFTSESQSDHYLYYKAHAVRNSCAEKPINRTLFIVNVPAFVDAECLKRLFSDCGRVDRVYFHDRPSPNLPLEDKSTFYSTIPENLGFKVAYCVFAKPKSVQRALSLDVGATPRVLQPDDYPMMSGIFKWQMEQNEEVIDEKALKEETEKYIAEYDSRVAEETKQARIAGSTPDDEGWTLVTSQSKRRAARPRLAHEDSRLQRRQMKLQQRRRQILNLYSFQTKETKRKQLAKLREKFEEDKKQIAQMRSQRKFRPF